MKSDISVKKTKTIILEQSKRANVGHIGSALSVADIVSALYQSVLRIQSPDDPDRERFILAKGHASLALYAVLYQMGWIDQAQLDSYCSDGSLLGVHPESALTGVEFSTGSLGQGLSMGVGAALAARMQKSPRRVFVLMSDGECDEGSVWEAAMFASHHKLANLVAIVDFNRQQALGLKKDVLDNEPFAQRWRGFGWSVDEVDGHNPHEIVQTINRLDTTSGPPHLILAHTLLGKGVSFMEGKVEWHYLPMSDSQYSQAMEEVESQL